MVSVTLVLFISFTFFYTSMAFERPFASYSQFKSFNVQRFGAKGDGRTDCTQAFLRAWDAACSQLGFVELYVPRGRYVLSPLTFEGFNCKSWKILFNICGIIVAPDDYRILAKSTSWITFHMTNGLNIKGGVLDAKGQSLWNCKKHSQSQCNHGAKSLSIENSDNVLVHGLTLMNSQMFHMAINGCKDIRLRGMTISADGNSPNTDGIHIERSTGISITYSNIYTGDDCISIGQDTKHVWIESIRCGPGHGISIGSLGRKNSQSGTEVRNVTVKSSIFTGTTNGLRIKTWATPIQGIVRDIYYLGAQMQNVQNPIIIDQFYCPDQTCPSRQASEIQISNVKYVGIKGTTASEVAIKLDCSWKRPCMGITLQDIHLYSSQQPTSTCNNAYGRSYGSIYPSSCLNLN